MSDAECATGLCVTQFAGGYCSTQCSASQTCPSGATCVELSPGVDRCLQSCAADTECRTGFVCSVHLCIPACTTSTECGPGNYCDSSHHCQRSGTPPPPDAGTPTGNSVGDYCAPCQTSDDCPGQGTYCLLISSRTGSSGACGSTCTRDTDCPSGGSCQPVTDRFGRVLTYNCAPTNEVCPVGTPDAGPTTPPPDAGPTTGTPDAGAVADYPAAHTPAPQVANAGGPVLKAPRFVPIFWANDDRQTETSIVDFLNRVGSTEYWKATTSEYGIGMATSTAPVYLTDTIRGQVDGNGIANWLAGKISTGVVPASDANTIYVLHYPAGVTIYQGNSVSCQDYGAYHSDYTTRTGASVAYAVIPRCGSFANMAGVDAITAPESHELIEAATDPYPNSNPSYAQPDDLDFFWQIALGGGETGDLCAQEHNAFTKFAELAYGVQRTWSNQAAAAGRDPCVPELPGEVYFNAAPEMPGTVSVNLGGGQVVKMRGISVPVGQSKTINVDLFSAGPVGPWQVSAQAGATATGQSGAITVRLGGTSGRNGDKLQLTITRRAASQYGFDVFTLTSTLGNEQHTWLGLVGG